MNDESLLPGQIDRLLRQLAEARATGAVRFDGPTSGTLFLDNGLIYFAVIDGRPLTAVELANAGIEHRMWQEAGTRPGARGHFADELFSLGCSRHAVESFVDERISNLVDGLRAIGAESVERTSARHGFGASVGLDPLRYVRTHEPPQPDTLISLDRSAATAVTIDAIVWNAIAALVAPFRYAELAAVVDDAAPVLESLQHAGLVTTVQPASDDHNRHRHDAATGAADTDDGPDGVDASDMPPPHHLFPDEDAEDYEEYVPDRVGRQTYAAIASMRASARTSEPSHGEKTHALRRLIEAVRGL